mgnify:FL=1
MNYEDQKIIDVDLNKEMRKSFLDYSMSVIVSRALPDVRDGLKQCTAESFILCMRET